MNGVSDALVPALLLLPVIDWIATVILIWLSRTASPKVGFLTERAMQAVIVSSVMTIFAVIFINTQTGFAIVPNDTARAITRVVTLVLGLGPVLWLWWYWRAHR